MDYKVTISSVRKACPFDPKKRSAAYCNHCKGFNDPCSGIGKEVTIASKKIGVEQMNKILNIVKAHGTDL